jgi:1-acyl-sn-glycerol-3-phosphate acyltransferase
MRDTDQKASEKTRVDHSAARLLEVVQNLVAEIHPSRPQTQAANLDSLLDRDLGLDSLSRVELLTRLEREFGLSLSGRAGAEADTPRDLLRALRAADRTSPDGDGRDVVSIELGDAEAVPQSAETLIDVLKWHVESHPSRPQVHFYGDDRDDDVATYQDIWDGALAVATGLQHRGLESGDRVSIMLPTGRDYYFAFFGILLAGGVPVPIYPPVRRTQIEDHLKRHRLILENAGTTALITVPEAKPFARILKSQVNTMRAVLTVDELSTSGGVHEQPCLKSGDMAFLQYTSGSTGQPKGVILTHANLLANIRVIGDALHIDDTDVVVSWLPLYHDMGLIGSLMGSLYYACPLVLMSPLDFITRPQRWLWAIHRYRGTLSASPNFGYELCLRRLKEESMEGLDLSSWRVALNGAEQVSAATIERFSDRFGPHGFRPETMMPVYGLAENALGVTFPPLGRRPLIDSIQRDELMHHGRAVPAGEGVTPLRVVACGQPLAQHEVRITDEGGRELPDRQVGRLQFRGASACSGYFRNAEATRELFNGDWLDSGDLAYADEGDIYVTGRAKDLVIRAGRNIAPSELEEAISGVAGIRKGRVAVFGSADPNTGTERLIVLAETREPGQADGLRRTINALAVDLVGTPPDDIRLVAPGTVLKTSSGKIRRQANREIYERGELGSRDRPVWWQIARVSVIGLTPWLRRMRRQTAAWVYAVYAWAVIVVIAPIFWPLVVIAPGARWSWQLARLGGRVLGFATGLTPKAHGLEHVPSSAPCVFVANHASYLDAFALMAVMPRPVSFVAKHQLKANPLVRLFLGRLHTQFVERFDKQVGIDNARRIGAKARSGWPLFYFPEGRLARMAGLRPFHMGAFVAAAESGVQVIPIALRGTRSALRPGTRFPRGATVTVTVGPPIGEATGPTGQKPVPDVWSQALRLRDASRAHILGSCGEPDLVADG